MEISLPVSTCRSRQIRYNLSDGLEACSVSGVEDLKSSVIPVDADGEVVPLYGRERYRVENVQSMVEDLE